MSGSLIHLSAQTYSLLTSQGTHVQTASECLTPNTLSFGAEDQVLQVCCRHSITPKPRKNINTRCIARFQMLNLIALACFIFTGVAVAQESDTVPGSERPMFTYLPATLHQPRNIIEAATTP